MYGDEAIKQAAEQPLDKWPAPSSEPFVIHLEHPEFSALCPRSGYPDSGTIVVDYCPGESVVELKAFKLYINSFRDRRISHEAVINEIADRLFAELQPRSLRVIGDFMRRGGVKTVVTVYREQKDAEWRLFDEYRPNAL